MHDGSIKAADIALAPTAWEAALANLAQAQAALDTSMAAYNVAEKAFYALRPARPTDDDANKEDYLRRARQAKHDSGLHETDAVYGRDLSGHSEAVKALLNCPAPDLAAVAYKIELAGKETLDVLELGSTLADLRRLGGA